MEIRLKIVESNSEINRLILQNIKQYLDTRIHKVANIVQTKLPPIIADGLRQEPEYASLLGGELRAELGIPDISAIDSIIEIISNSIELESKSLSIGRNGLKGGFILKIIRKENLGGALDSSYGIVKTDTIDIPWLEWLCFKGNEILIKDYVVRYGPNPYSRSGLAIMKKSEGSSWRVPPQFIGTENNNWITRAIDRVENNVYDLFRKTIEAEI